MTLNKEGMTPLPIEQSSTRERLIKKSPSVKGFFKRESELRGKWLIYCGALIIIIATVSLTLFLVWQGLRVFLFDGVNPIHFLFRSDWNPGDAKHPTYGAFPIIFGSFAVTALAAIVATPISIGTALFMTEIAKKWGDKALRPVIEILVGIPSVVYGLIGLTLIVPFIANHSDSIGYGLLPGMIVVGMMILPTITSIAADALHSIPNELKNASYALGATRWQTIAKVILPAALPSLLTAVVLGMARAFGEALAVQMVIGNVTTIPHSLLEPASTLTTIITLHMGNTTTGSPFNHALWALGLVLLTMSYIFILIIRYLSRRRTLS
ncbi:phosphate transport system permease protein [Pullulanibacillus pueri]|uniref:Phosphate transport system permease protein n=1 Tax=Pullulanibacillus pueri TaxID=1437324 RepID=A0A8J2ZTD9_9BACL|nr:phosphate ABC transporter permease subunit PstC [Pullulanibacillus pueri]MBM7680344.1 phosphate transport system permease protein [Pullulanibacillus pueri]GGH75546.1 putative ABC transporter permease protein YqgH [Pullulanibacillus pueri]